MSIVLYRVFGSDYRQDHRFHVLSAAIQIQKTGQDHHFFPHMVAVGSHPVQKQGKGFLAHALLPRQAAVIHDSIVGMDYHKNRAVSTKSFENTPLSAACKKKQGKLWQKERRLDGASPLDKATTAKKFRSHPQTIFIPVLSRFAEYSCNPKEAML